MTSPHRTIWNYLWGPYWRMLRLLPASPRKQRLLREHPHVLTLRFCANISLEQFAGSGPKGKHMNNSDLFWPNGAFKKIHDLYALLYGSPPLLLFGKGGAPAWELWGWLNTWHPTMDRWYRQPRFLTAQGKRTPRDMQGCAGALRHRVESGRCLEKRVRCLLVPMGGCDRLEQLCRLPGHWSLLLRDEQELCLVPTKRRLFGLGIISVGVEWGAIQSYPGFPQMPRQHIIVDLNFRPSTIPLKQYSRVQRNNNDSYKSSPPRHRQDSYWDFHLSSSAYTQRGGWQTRSTVGNICPSFLTAQLIASLPMILTVEVRSCLSLAPVSHGSRLHQADVPSLGSHHLDPNLAMPRARILWEQCWWG